MIKFSAKKGFTIVELLVVVVVIGILATSLISLLGKNSREKAFYTRTQAETNAMSNALTLYIDKANEYPPDVSRNIPSVIKEYLTSLREDDGWPDAPYPGSVYDYDNWVDPLDGSQIIQISVRFCPVGGPTTACRFPNEPWINSSWDYNSSLYYCIKGKCRSHISQPVSHPGKCLNCL
jgi:prepilin-type N-terminal cleavage/methylation domain-containing protein